MDDHVYSLLSFCSSLLNGTDGRSDRVVELDQHPSSLHENSSGQLAHVQNPEPDSQSPGNHASVEQTDSVVTLQSHSGTDSEEGSMEAIPTSAAARNASSAKGTDLSSQVPDDQTLPRRGPQDCTPEETMYTEFYSLNKFVCRECGKDFKSELLYREHQCSSNGERPLKCKYCEKSFVQSHALYLHEQNHPVEKRYNCDFCDKTFPRQYALLVHMRTHTGEKPYKCSFCNKAFSEKRIGLLHEKLHRNDSKVVCEVCGAQFRQKFGLQRHQNSIKTRKCSECREIFNSLCALKAHQGMAHPDKLHVCEVCNALFPTAHRLAIHKPCATNWQPVFACKKCAKTFNSTIELESHNCTSLDDSSFPCDICKEVLNSSEEWMAHRMRHSVEEMFVCTHCPMVFQSKRNLVRHMAVHTDSLKENSLREKLDNTDSDENELLHDGRRNRAPVTSCDGPLSTSTKTGKSGAVANATRPSGLQARSRNGESLGEDQGNATNKNQFLCHHCGKVCRDRRSFRTHQKTHSEYRPFKCGFCQKGFKQSITLTHHVRIHTGERPFSCSICNKSFTSNGSLKSHMIVHSKTSAKSYYCRHCNKEFKQRGSRFSHERLHTDYKSFCCEDCGAKFMQKQGLISHHWMPTKLRSCSLCDEEFETLCSLHVHQDTCHSDEKYSCERCGRTFCRDKHLQRHKPCDPASSLHYACKICTKTCGNPEDLKSHVCTVAHSSAQDRSEPPLSKSRFLCFTCGKHFSDKASFDSHSRVHSAYRPYDCQFCGKSFKYQSAHLSHERGHTGKKPHTCSECGKSFARSDTFQGHMLTHEGREPYRCKLCSVTFLDKSSFTIHKRQHTEEKLFCCDECGLQFKTKNRLVGHLKKTLTPAICPKCEEAFPNTCALDAHHVQIHVEERTYCSECGKAFGSQDTLKKHLPCGGHPEKWFYACRKCFCAFNSLPALQSHQCSADGGAAFICTECNESYSDGDKWKEHKKTHRGSSSEVKCVQCHMVFKTEHNLARHDATECKSLWECRNLKSVVVLKPLEDGAKYREEAVTDEVEMSMDNNALCVPNASRMVEKDQHTCQHCGLIFDDDCSHQNHMVCHNTDRPLQCCECKKRFTQKLNLSTHIKIHHKSNAAELLSRSLPVSSSNLLKLNKYTCSKCRKIFDHKFQLVAHSSVHSSERTFECLECHQGSANKSKLKAHIKYHHDEIADEVIAKSLHTYCNVCLVAFTTKPAFKSHLKVHHGKSGGARSSVVRRIPERKRIECAYCGKKFNKNSTLQLHMHTHTGGKPFTCSCCSASFNQKSNLVVHIKRRHFEMFSDICAASSVSDHSIKIVSSGAERQFKCELCTKAFNQKAHLLAHMKCHTGEKPFRCSACSKNFSQKTNMKAHIRLWHSDCFDEVLEKSLSHVHQPSPKRMKDATITHEEGRPCKCEACLKSPTQKVQSRVTRRTGVKPFKCSACSKAFALKSSLKNHIQVWHSACEKVMNKSLCAVDQQNQKVLKRHTDERLYLCQVCSCEFVTEEALTNHTEESHTREDVQCECGKTFQEYVALQAHLQESSKNGNYVCSHEHCDESLSLQCLLEEHQQAHSMPNQREQSEIQKTPHIGTKHTNADSSRGKNRIKQNTKLDTAAGGTASSVVQILTMFACNKCDKIYEQQTDLKAHMQTHKVNTFYPCDKCSGTFRVKSDLEHHMIIHETDKDAAKK